MWWTVEAATPVQAVSWTGPSHRRMRSETIRLTTALGVRWGHECGRLER